MKYNKILIDLEEDVLYTPAKIVRKAAEAGLLEKYFPDAPLELTMRRARISLGRFSRNHNFPREGDGVVVLPGQPACVG